MLQPKNTELLKPTKMIQNTISQSKSHILQSTIEQKIKAKESENAQTRKYPYVKTNKKAKHKFSGEKVNTLRVPLQAQGASIACSSSSSWHILHSTTTPPPLTIPPSFFEHPSPPPPAPPLLVTAHTFSLPSPLTPPPPPFTDSKHADAMILSTHTMKSSTISPSPLPSLSRLQARVVSLSRMTKSRERKRLQWR